MRHASPANTAVVDPVNECPNTFESELIRCDASCVQFASTFQSFLSTTQSESSKIRQMRKVPFASAALWPGAAEPPNRKLNAELRAKIHLVPSGPFLSWRKTFWHEEGAAFRQSTHTSNTCCDPLAKYRLSQNINVLTCYVHLK